MQATASHLSALFASEGLPPPPLPAGIEQAMLLREPGCFASPGLRAHWRFGLRAREGAAHWLQSGCAEPAAWCAVDGRGFHSQNVLVAFESPRCGIFVRKLTSQAFGDAQTIKLRVDGTFALMRRLIDAVQGVSSWPADKRLALVDDDSEGLPHWAWVAATGAQWNALAPDALGWISALAALQSIPR